MMKTLRLGDVCEIVNGGTPKTGVAEYWDGDILWITPKDLGKVTARTTGHTERKLSQLGVQNSSAKIIPAHSVVLSTRAPIGHVAVTTQQMAFNQGCRGLIPSEKLLVEYLYYFLKFSKEKLNELGTGTTFRELSAGALKDVEIPLSSLDEQRRVVERLDAAFENIDRAIELTEKNIWNCQRVFDLELQKLVRDQSVDVKRYTLREVSTDFGRGKSKHRPRNDKKLYGGPYPFIQTGDIRNSHHTIDTYKQTYNELGLAQSKLWPTGTVCITIAANIAETSILGVDACFPDSVIGVVVDPLISSSDFVEYLLQSYKASLQSLGKGSAQDNINLGTFEALKFPFPSLSVQEKIIKKLNALSSQTSSLRKIYQKRIETLHVLKQSLLAQAFSQNEVE